jgi:hypothetical protein
VKEDKGSAPRFGAGPSRARGFGAVCPGSGPIRPRQPRQNPYWLIPDPQKQFTQSSRGQPAFLCCSASPLLCVPGLLPGSVSYQIRKKIGFHTEQRRNGDHAPSPLLRCSVCQFLFQNSVSFPPTRNPCRCLHQKKNGGTEEQRRKGEEQSNGGENARSCPLFLSVFLCSSVPNIF